MRLISSWKLKGQPEGFKFEIICERTHFIKVVIRQGRGEEKIKKIRLERPSESALSNSERAI